LSYPAPTRDGHIAFVAIPQVSRHSHDEVRNYGKARAISLDKYGAASQVVTLNSRMRPDPMVIDGPYDGPDRTLLRVDVIVPLPPRQ
jgi:hypothetical protein